MPAPITCHFCRKPATDVRQIVVGEKGGAICDGCVEQAVDVIDKQRAENRLKRAMAARVGASSAAPAS